MFLHYQHLTMLPLPLPLFTMQMTNLPFLTQIFLQMVRNNDLPSSFLSFDTSGPAVGASGERTGGGGEGRRALPDSI